MTPQQIRDEYVKVCKEIRNLEEIRAGYLAQATELVQATGKNQLDIDDFWEIRKVEVDGADISFYRKPYTRIMIKEKKKLTPEEDLVSSVEKGKYQ